MTDTEANLNAVQVSKTLDGINTITINRPHQRNAIDGPAREEL
jgi:1,4-dihydroxy-2-naphthoyl-CoA synthase